MPNIGCRIGDFQCNFSCPKFSSHTMTTKMAAAWNTRLDETFEKGMLKNATCKKSASFCKLGDEILAPLCSDEFTNPPNFASVQTTVQTLSL